ncbi:oligosaccharide flippase family protein [Paenibacillus sp. GCM10023252]|uniref:oligosaccharide flippase family protein n=1 Tax=Paenibacillus sp. GCM10023252 TaxID=3252649 RepID=UPI003611FAA9
MGKDRVGVGNDWDQDQGLNKMKSVDSSRIDNGEKNVETSSLAIQPWLGGAMVMGAAALISKLLGTLQKIPLQNLAGDRVFGIYNTVYPFYQLLLVLATAGLPTAVALLMVERMEAGAGESGTRRVLKAALLLLGMTGAATYGLVWVSASHFGDWVGDRETIASFKSVAWALLVVPLVAAMRGYYQGLGRMTMSAGSQVVEQAVRVAVMLALLAAGLANHWDDARLSAGALLGSAAGGAAALLLFVIYGARERVRMRRELLTAEGRLDERRDGMLGESVRGSISSPGLVTKQALSLPLQPSTLPSGVSCESRIPAAVGSGRRDVFNEMRQLARLALPIALGSIVVPIAGAVDALTVPRLLVESGRSEEAAMSAFGIYSRGQTLIQLVTMVAAAAGAALVPGLAAARSKGELLAAKERAAWAMNAAWALGAAASLGLVLLAEPINIMLYANASGTMVMAIVGATALAGAVSAVAAPLLQGLGAVRIPAVLLLVAALLKGALNAALVPAYGIAGAAWGGFAALTAAALLGAAAVRRAAAAGAPSMPGAAAGLRRRAAGTVLALAVMAAALVLAERALGPALAGWLPPRAAATALALTGVAVGAGAYGAAMLRSGAVRARELARVPGGARLAARLRRWRVLPPASRGE